MALRTVPRGRKTTWPLGGVRDRGCRSAGVTCIRPRSAGVTCIRPRFGSASPSVPLLMSVLRDSTGGGFAGAPRAAAAAGTSVLDRGSTGGGFAGTSVLDPLDSRSCTGGAFAGTAFCGCRGATFGAAFSRAAAACQGVMRGSASAADGPGFAGVTSIRPLGGGSCCGGFACASGDESLLRGEGSAGPAGAGVGCSVGGAGSAASALDGRPKVPVAKEAWNEVLKVRTLFCSSRTSCRASYTRWWHVRYNGVSTFKSTTAYRESLKVPVSSALKMPVPRK